MSGKAEEKIKKLMNNLKGHSLLANVIEAIKKDKKQQAKKVSFRLKESLFKKLKESMIED